MVLVDWHLVLMMGLVGGLYYVPVMDVGFGGLDQGDVERDPQHAGPYRVDAH